MMGPVPARSEGEKGRRLVGGYEVGCAPPRAGLGWGSLAPGSQDWGSRLCAEGWGSGSQKRRGSGASLPCCWQAMAAVTARQSSGARGVLKMKVPSPESLRRPASMEKTFCRVRGRGEGLAPTLGSQQLQGGRGGTYLILAKLAKEGVGPGEQGLAGLWVLQRQALGKGREQVVPLQTTAGSCVRPHHQHREFGHWEERARWGSAAQALCRSLPQPYPLPLHVQSCQEE